MSEAGQSNENEQPPSTPQLCIGIVQDYTSGHSSKITIVRSILAAFNESSAYEDLDSDQLDATMGTYLSMLDQHDDARRIAAVRGERFGDHDGSDAGVHAHTPASY
jgi:hypothetical protein